MEATLQRKSSGGIIVVIITKIITKENVPRNYVVITLRAKGTLISEPRFSTTCEMRFFPRDKGQKAFVEGSSMKRPFSLSRVGKMASRGG